MTDKDKIEQLEKEVYRLQQDNFKLQLELNKKKPKYDDMF